MARVRVVAMRAGSDRLAASARTAVWASMAAARSASSNSPAWVVPAA